MRNTARLLGMVIALQLGAALPAPAQIHALTPIFRDLSGGAVWGSFGASTRSSAPRRDERPIWRAGFAAFYGPFGGGGDTTLVRTVSVADSTDTSFVDADGRVTHRSIGTVTVSRTESRHLGRGGKVLLAAGYQHSAFYRIAGTPLDETVSVGGLYLATLLGPYDLPFRPRRLAWYAGLGGTVVRLQDVAGRIDTLGVKLTTERTFAPELHLMLAYTVSPNYRVLAAGTYQYLRFGSVAYEAVEDGRLIPGPTLARLPDEIRLESWHLSLGVSFVASSLIPAR